MRYFIVFFCMLLLSMTLTSCGAIETIFKAGMAWAFILIGLVVALILFVVFKAKKK